MSPTNTSRGARLSGMVLLAALTSHSALARAQTAEAPAELGPPSTRIEEARERQRRARDLFANGSYDAALAEFEAVYGALEGHRLRHVVLLDVGQCHLRLGRFDMALRYYRRFLIEAPVDATERATVEADITRLEATLATVRVSANVPGAEVWVDNRRVGSSPGELLLPAGSHLVELRASGHLPSRREVQVAGRARVTLPPFRLESVAPRRGLTPLVFWSTAGAAVALAVVGGAVGLSALSAHDDVLARQADAQRRFTVLQGDLDSVQARASVADIFFGSAATVAVSAGILYFVTDWRPRRDAAPAGLRTSLSVTSRGATLGFAGSF
jgi:tetratricopeptide (TPR) repeat protein